MMLRRNDVLFLCFFTLIQSSWAESTTSDEELDEEFLETLGSFDVDDEDWYEVFWSTIEEEAQEDSYGEKYE